jgi:hypothetical protein
LLAVMSLWVADVAHAQALADFVSPGALSRHHAEVSGITQCVACHDVGGGVSATKCMDCHERVEEQVRTNTGFHAGKGQTCHDCHPDHRGLDAPLTEFHEQAFDHSQTGFDLHGAHEPLACNACHTEDGTFIGLEQACMTCHEDPHNAIEGRAQLLSCETCHTDVDWSVLPLATAVFDHDDPLQADFPLHGQHGDVACKSCHEDWAFVPVASDVCTDCHEDIHHGQFAPRTCEDCHTVEIEAFALRDYDHDTTDYPLRGQHADVACEDCHGDGEDAQYVDLPHETCQTCHDDLHDGQFAPRTCEDCHTVATFSMRDFDHDQTDYPLDVGHQDVACEGCHGDGAAAVYVDLPHESCSTCHDDPHEGQFLPRDCDSCHSVSLPSFELASFDHDQTDFPLRNLHMDVACEDCHGDGPTGAYATLPFDDCASCHEDAHEARFAPDRCDSCHTDGLWTVDDFDHDRTDYPLTGSHAEVACVDCHGDGEDHVLTPLNFGSCVDCHADEEPHQGSQDAASCSSCHVTDEWALVAYDHLANTGFPLVGQHEPLACMDCHEDPTFVLEGAECEVCHLDDEPEDHFDGACGECHLPEGWLPATLGGEDHSVTGFALRGSHAVLDCYDCHADASTGPFCIDCHADDDPHRNLLGDQCDTCHTEVDWLRTDFNHAATGFPLRGTHRLARCDDCHATGYANTPTTCVRCHDNERPKDALHSDPATRTCDLCHRPYDWDNVRFVLPGGF